MDDAEWLEVSDGMVCTYFEREDTDTSVSMAQIFQQMETHESEFSSPAPESLGTTALLTALKVDSPCSDFSRLVNDSVDMLHEATLEENVKAFLNIIWFHLALAMENHITEHADQLNVKVSRADFTTATAKLHQLFTSP